MDVSALSGTGTTPQPASPQSGQSDEMSKFLSLLTAQIQNQDPLEPLDANQFIEQLATINSLEQQIEANGHLEDILDQLRSA